MYKDFDSLIDKDLPKFKVLKEYDTIDHGFIKIYKEDVLVPTKNHTYTHAYIRHPGAVIILPFLDDDTVIMVYQYRHSIGQWILEFPAGTCHGPDDDRLVRAHAELTEETGYEAKTMKEIGILHPSPGMISEVQQIYIAKDLTYTETNRDADELMEVVAIKVARIPELIRSGNFFTDAKSIATWHLASIV